MYNGQELLKFSLTLDKMFFLQVFKSVHQPLFFLIKVLEAITDSLTLIYINNIFVISC